MRCRRTVPRRNTARPRRRMASSGSESVHRDWIARSRWAPPGRNRRDARQPTGRVPAPEPRAPTDAGRVPPRAEQHEAFVRRAGRRRVRTPAGRVALPGTTEQSEVELAEVLGAQPLEVFLELLGVQLARVAHALRVERLGGLFHLD